MSKKKLVVLSSLGLAFAPLLAFAQVGVSGATTVCHATTVTIGDFLCKIANILNKVIPVLIVLGVVYFVWGVVQYIMTGDEAKKKEGRTKMIYGIIGLVVIVAMWGLVFMVKNTFGIENVGNVQLPTLDISF